MTARSKINLLIIIMMLQCHFVSIGDAISSPISGDFSSIDLSDLESTLSENIIEDVVAASVTRRQYKEGFGNGASATFNSTPLPGSLLVAIAGHRKGPGDHSISGSGWTEHIAFTTLPYDTNGRRGLSVWTKIAGNSESSTVTVDFGDTNSKLLIQEFSITGGNFTGIDKSASNQGSASPSTSLSTGTTSTTSSANTLVVSAIVGRYSFGNTPVFGGGLQYTVGSNEPGTEYPSLFSAYAHKTSSGTQSSTASWNTSIEASAGIIAYGINVANTGPCEIAEWNFEEGSGSIVTDSEGNVPNANINGPSWTTRSSGGSALSFDGSNDYIDLGNDNDLKTSGDMTLMMWLRPRSFSSRCNPWAKAYGGEGTITQETNGILNFYWGTSGINGAPYAALGSSSALSLNQWTHVAVTRELSGGTNTIKWYFNGSQVSSTNSSQMASVSNLNATIGKGYAGHYNGDIDAVKLFQCAMTSSEITTEMNETTSGNGNGGGNPSDSECNEMANHQFDSGTTNWILSNNSAASASLGIDNTSQLSGTNSAKVSISNGSNTNWHIQLLQGPFDLDASKTYNISFKAKAASNRSIGVMFQLAASPWTNYYFTTQNITTTAQTYTLSNISMSGSTANANFGFFLGGSNADVWIDDVVFEEVDCNTSGSGNCDILVRAEGDCGGEVLDLKVGGTTVASFNLTTSYANYTYSGYDGTQPISIYFHDSGCSPDPNVYIDYITVDGNTYQTETSGTHSNTGCNGNEYMYCTGTISFGTLSCSGGSSGGGSQSCEDGVTMDIYAEGTSSSNNIYITVPNLSNVNETTIEVAYKGCYPGSTITVGSASGNIVLNEEAYNGNSYSAYVYRKTVSGGVTNLYESGACGSGTSGYGLQSMTVYVERSVDSGMGYSSTFTTIGGYNVLETFSLPIPTSANPRDVTLQLPISEITSDNRFLTVNASSNTGSASASTTITGPDYSLGDCCFAMPTLTIYNVPGNSTAINFEIDTRASSNPGYPAAGGAGQSFSVSGTIYTSYECPCPAFTAEAGPNASYCIGDSHTLSGSASGGSSPYSYSWSPSAGLSNSNIASPVATPSSTTTYTLTVTSSDGCVETDQVTITVNENYTSGGVIDGFESNCGSYDPANITSSDSPSGGSGGSSIYVWQKRDRDCGASWSSWSNISGATSATYNPPTITKTTQYRRLARRSVCNSSWAYSNPVTKVVVENFTDGGTVAGDESECSAYNPAEITNISDASGGCGGQLITNPSPGFPIDFQMNNCSWIDYDLGNDLAFMDNGNGTITISGTIVDGVDADFDACNSSPCGGDDHWYLEMTLTDKQDYATFTGNGGVPLVHSNCNSLKSDLEYWNLTGTLTGLGCNTGRTINLNSPKAPHRLQIGYGGNSGDSNCDFGLSTWFNTSEGAQMLGSDIYGFIDAPTIIWQKREMNCASESYGSWSTISGATDLSYDPPSVITVTTQYRRLARRTTGCSPGWRYSNIVTKEVIEQYTSAGTISGDESSCSSYNPSLITSTASPTGGCGGTELLQWEKREWNCSTESWGPYSTIAGATSLTYDPTSVLTVTTEYRRLSRRSSLCSPDWAISNSVVKEVVIQTSDGGIIYGDESMCGGYDPQVIGSATPATGGCGGTLVYYWGVRTVNCDGSKSSWVNFWDGPTHDPGPISETKEYIRRSRRSNGCSTSWTYSNYVTKEVIDQYTGAGSIAADESFCDSYNPAIITSTQDPVAGCGGTPSHVWEKAEYDCNTESFGAFTSIPGAISTSYDPPTISVTTKYRRLSTTSPDEAISYEVNESIIPYKKTNLNENYNIPKFNNLGGTRTLQKVILSIDHSIRSSGFSENRSNSPSLVNLQMTGTSAVLLGGNTISSTNMGFNSGSRTFGAAIPVPAQGNWVGDLSGSTLLRMVDLIDGHLANNTDPRTDSGWVTNATGNPVHDNDIAYFEPIVADTTVYLELTSATDLAKFMGTGNIDLVYDAQATTSIAGSNRYTHLETRTQSTANVTYIYSEPCSHIPVITNEVTKEVVVQETSGGTISGGQDVCANSFNPPLITSSQDPSGGCGGTQEIIWYKWEHDCNTGTWTSQGIIPGANSLTYDPPAITVSSRYRRYVRRSSDCSGTNGTWLVSDYAVFNLHNDLINPGTLSSDQESCGPFNPSIITGTSPTGGCTTQDLTYQWQFRLGYGGAWTDISGATSKDYDPGTISETTQYQRLVETASCGNQNSNFVTLTVNELPTAALSNETVCPGENIVLEPEVCEYYPNIKAQRLLENTGWGNQYGVGGSGLTGDGTLCFDFVETNGLTSYQMIGLNTDPFSNVSYNTIDFAMYVLPATNYNRINIYENGSSKGTHYSSSTSFNGSTLCVRRTGTTIEYLLDGSVVYTSLTASTGTLYYDNAFHSTSVNQYSEFENIMLCAAASDIGMSYSWSGGGSAATKTVSSAGTYTVTVTDNNGCTTSTSSVISQFTPPIASAINDGPLTCAKTSVTLTATPSGMTYAWSGGGTSRTKVITNPGTYTVTVTDANGCTDTAATIVTEETTPTNVFCEQYRVFTDGAWGPWISFGPNCEIELCELDGTTDIQVDGGPNINTGWVWEDEDNNVDSEVDELVVFNNIGASDAGTYTGTLTNENGCVSSFTFDVIVVSSATASISGNQQICVGETATLTSSTTGGLGTATYQWEKSSNNTTWTEIPGANSASYTTPPLNAKTYYRLTVSWNGLGCSNVTSTVSTVDVDTESIAVTADAFPMEICPGGSTVLTVHDTIDNGGLLDYTSWSVGSGSTGQFYANGTSSENPRKIDKDPFGNNAVIWEAQPEAASGPDGGWNTELISIDHTKTYRYSVWVNRKVVGTSGRFYMGTNGYGSTNGLARISDGSTQTNTYFWYSSSPPTATELPEDEWILVVGHIHSSNHTGNSNHAESGRYSTTDGYLGDINTDYQWLPQSTSTVHRSYLYYSSDVNVRQQWAYPRLDVIDGSEPSIQDIIQGFDVNGGLGEGANWEWYTGSCGGTSVGSGKSITVSPSATTTYYVRGEGGVCNDSDCASVTVTVNTPPSASATNNGDLTCSKVNSVLTALPTGMTYAWSGGGTNQTKTVTTPGTYTVTVTDPNTGCSATAQTVVIQDITNPNANATNNGPLTCAKTIVTLTASSTTAGATYAWSGGGTNATKTVSTPGTYTVTVTDPSNGCTATAQTLVTQDITNPNASTSNDGPLTCSNTTATLTASSTTTGVTYSWSGGGTNATKTVSTPGTYTVTVTDPSNGCTATAQTVVTQNITNPNVNATNNGPLTCSKTNVTLTASSTTSGATYAWSGGGTNTTKTVSTPGTYTVTVTDPSNGCTATAQTIVIQNNTAPTADAGANSSICFGDDIELTASGGGTYQWSHSGGANATIIVNPSSTTTYTVTVTDTSNGCTDEASVTVTVNPTPTVTVSTTDATCEMDNGTATAVPSGGAGPYSYIWSRDNFELDFSSIIGDKIPSTSSLDTAININGLVSSGYVTLDYSTDRVKIPNTKIDGLDDFSISIDFYMTNINVLNPLLSAASASQDNALLIAYNSNTSFSIFMMGGTTGYSTSALVTNRWYTIEVRRIGDQVELFLDGSSLGTKTINTTIIDSDYSCLGEEQDAVDGGYNNTQSFQGRLDNLIVKSLIQDDAATISGLASGEINVTITDINGCTATGTGTIEDLPTTEATVTNDGPLLCSFPIVTLTALPAGQSYAWSGGGSGQTKTVLSGGTYTVTVTDSNGCTSTAETVVNQDLTPPNVNASNNGPLTCSNLNSVLTASSTTTGVTYAWSGGGTNATKTVSAPGTYTVTVTDPSNGCTATAQTTVIQNIASPNAVASANQTICNDGTTTISASANGGSGGGYTYSWDQGLGAGASHTVTVNATTTYIVTVTDSNGCTGTDDVTITVVSTPQVSIVVQDPTICQGETATITSSVSGGTGTLSYQWQQSAQGNVWTNISGATSANYTTGALNATTHYQLIVSYTGLGCKNATSNAGIVTVETESIVVSATAEQEEICLGGSTILTVNGPAANGGKIDYSTWAIGTGSQDKFYQNGSTEENHRILGTDPWGNSTVVWEARPDAASNADGGWNHDYLPIDHTKTYRISTWVNRKVISNSGRFFMGVNTSGSVTGVERVSDGTIIDNSYFWVSTNPAPTTLPEDEWVLVVGHVYPSNHTGTANHNDSGRYELNGNKIGSISNDYQWLPESTTARPRTYLYYTTDTEVRQQWVYPRFDVLDGTEPSIDDILNGFDVNNGLGTGASYQWFTGSCGGTLIGTGETITVNPTTTTTYYVRATGNCNTTACENVTVTVNNPPVSAATNDGPLTCADTDAILTATPAGMTYAWSGGGTSQTKTVSAPGTYIVTVTDSNGCSATASTTVTEDLTPPVADAGTDQEICATSDATLTATGGVSYEWSHSAGNTASVTVTPVSTTTYTVTVTAANGCTDTDDIIVEVNEGPTNAGVIAGDEDACGSYDPATITSTTDASGQVGLPISYNWQKRELNCATGLWSAWSDITGAHSVGYDSPTITTTTQYRRLAGQNGCTSWLISNVITKEVIENSTDPGTIATNQTGCDSFDPDPITGTAASGGCGSTAQYQWQVRPLGGSWANIPGATGLDYDPSTISETMQYRRRVRSIPCPWVNSNIVTMTITEASFTAVALGSNLDCEGNCSGTIDVVVDHALTGNYMLEYTFEGNTSQVGPFTQDSATITNLCAGFYSNIRVISTETTCSDTWAGNISISESHADWEHVTHADDVSDCHANTCDGAFVVDANMGVTGPFNLSYKYEGNLVQLGPYTSAGDIRIDGLCAGTYSEITITSIESGCSDVWPTDIIISTPDFNANITQEIDDDCQINEGAVTIRILNGVYPYTIEWSNEDNTESGTTTLNQHGNITLYGLVGGSTYCFKVTDSNGCIVN